MLLDVIIELIDDEDSIYVGELPPDAPNNTVCVSRTRGRAPDLDLEGLVFKNPSIRVLVRDDSYPDAENRITAIMNKLSSTYHHESDPEILGFFIESDIIPLGIDDKHRTSLYVIFQVKHE